MEVVEMKGSDGGGSARKMKMAEMEMSDAGGSARKMKMAEMERRDGGGSVKKTKVGNEDTCEWVVENGSVGGHTTGEIRNSGSMNLQLRSIGALDPPRRPSLHAHRR
ncbi:hypothetical protein TIFTF001_053474 [Ficus carica]|uniref:Uncharacterized protein n=1 Tax=Ficus carica TaxID=3494 RepID=A0AA88EBZ7_FICCA|nr:hypothetical protein TIFTF001_053474 [Ficus carica]